MKLPVLSKKIARGILLVCALAGDMECARAQYIYTFAGNVPGGYSGDGGPATAAALHGPCSVVIDGPGNVYIADFDNDRIRKVNTSGIISTVAGNGIRGFSGDGGPATAAELYAPDGITIDGLGNLYFSEYGNFRIRKVNTSGIISTIAGNGTSGFSGDGGPATAASLQNASGVAVDVSGNVYIADCSNYRIRKVSISGIISTFAGTGSSGYSGDGGVATAAAIGGPRYIAFDGVGNMYFTDYANNVIRKVNSSGIISTIAGNGILGDSGDGGPATAAEMHWPMGIAFDGADNIYVAEYLGNRVRKVNTSGIISTYAGYGGMGFGGDGGPATAAMFNLLVGVATDGSGMVYIGDGNRVRKICYPPTAATISGPDSMVCVGSTLSLTASVPGGAWGSATGHTSVSGGTVTGITPGIDTISYTLTNSCYFTRTLYAVTVNPLPAAGVISGTSPICAGAADTFIATTAGGVWSSSAPSVATISTSGIAAGIAAGTTVISYTVTNSCGSSVAIFALTISALPHVPPITGPHILCTDAGIALADSLPGGVWGSSNTSIATVDTVGHVSKSGVGIDTIYYTVTTPCGTSSVMHVVTVSALPVVSVISGPATLCADSSFVFTDSAAGGIWGLSNTNATVNTVGRVTGVSAGYVTLTYAVSNLCGTTTVSSTMHILACDSILAAPYIHKHGSMTVMPNPSKGTFMITINTPASEHVQVVVANMLGVKVHEFTMISNTPGEVNLPMPAGMYIMSVYCAGSSFQQKIILQ